MSELSLHPTPPDRLSTAGPPAWRTLLTGAAAAETRRVIDDVADTLATSAVDGGSFSQGQAGIALLFAHLHLDRPSVERAALAEQRLEAACESLERYPMGPGLFGGFAGIGWTALYLAPLLGGSEEEIAERVDALDDAILRALERTPREGDYDLISGLAGLAVYALEPPIRPAGRAIVERVVEHLAALARPMDGGGVAWFTPPASIPAGQRRWASHGYYNLGVAHGVPGVVAVLAACHAAGVAACPAGELLGPAVDWLLAQRLDRDFGSRFPAWVGDDVPRGGTRLAWCYGDLGVATVLYFAGQAAGRDDWRHEALDTARLAARRTLEDAGVYDAGLCHGAAGLGHLFNRLHQASGDPLLAGAARRWLRATLDLRRPGEAVAGFPKRSPDLDGTLRWHADPGLLTGAAGVALALLAAVSSDEPGWDRPLLASPLIAATLPPASASTQRANG